MLISDRVHFVKSMWVSIRNGSSTSVLELESAPSTFSEVLDGVFKSLDLFKYLCLSSDINHIGSEDKHKCFNCTRIS